MSAPCRKMKTHRHLFYFYACAVYFVNNAYCSEDMHIVASKTKADQHERLRCGYNIIRLWTSEVAHSPFVAAPLITDVDADGHLDIVAAPLSESQTVISGETGKTLPDTHWPTQKLDSSVFSSPLQYDINSDGMLDILFVTSSGDLVFYTPNGTALTNYFMELPPVYVKEDWYKEVDSASESDIHKYVSSDAARDRKYLAVDPHVLATPVIADLNNDNKLEELVIPVSYYFDPADYRLPENFLYLNYTNLNKYVVAGITIVNLRTMTIMKSLYLDLTMKNSAYPAYVLYSPTVIDMDRNGGDLEIVIGTSAGNIHIINWDRPDKTWPGFPYTMATIHGQITVADVNKDGTLEIIAIDTSGNVVCLNHDGTLTWEVQVSGTSSPGTRLVDLDGDGYLEVIIVTNKGDVYAINGVTGKVVDNWPIRTGHPISSNILATRVSSTRKQLDLVFLTGDGSLHIVSTDQSCRTHFPISETSLVQITSHDLIAQSEGIELLISTNDGTLICLGSGNEVNDADIDQREVSLLSLPTEMKSPNDFQFGAKKPGIYVIQESRSRPEVTGSEFSIEFEIIDPTYKPMPTRTSMYKVKTYFGSNLLQHSTYARPGVYTVQIPAWSRPSSGHVTLVLTNQKGQIFQDIFPIKFNQVILEDLQWLLMAPFVAMVIILLVNHGFPAKDLLPTTFQAKTR